MKNSPQNSLQNIHEALLLLVRSERKILAQILEKLQIVSDQKLFLDFGRSSLLDYCIKDLGYSESAAIRRIKALKLARALPEAKEAIASGALTLSHAATMQSLFERHSQETRKALPLEKKRKLLAKVRLRPNKRCERSSNCRANCAKCELKWKRPLFKSG